MTTAAESVHEYLAGRGFKVRPAPRGCVASYRGSLPFRGGNLRIQLNVVDWRFKRRPEILLLERPAALQGFRPHIGRGKDLCYVDRESVLMDPYQPVQVIGACLRKAEETLEDIAGDRLRIDVQSEFLVHWLGSESVPIFLWAAASARRELLAVGASWRGGSKTFTITDDAARTSKMLAKLGVAVGDDFGECVCEFVTTKFPSFDPDTWPPNTLKEVLVWLRGWDASLEKSLLGRLESTWTVNRRFLVFLISSPSGQFGFHMEVKYQSDNERKRLAKDRGERRQRILRQDPRIVRFNVTDISPSFVHGRNQTDGRTLAGKRIAVVGCGTIGGYLATFLARLGTGFGDGILSLYDPQDLAAENLGRHVLSMRDLFRNKALAVKELILSEFPYLNVVASDSDATLTGDLFDADLVIDASGSSAIASILNAENLRLLKAKQQSAVLHVWVEGAGDAARSLLVDSLDHMCFECQYLRPTAQPIRDRFPLVDNDRHTGRTYPGDCSSYMPFAVSAATAAAGLALDATRDWANNSPGARFRSHRLNKISTQSRKDSSPEPLASCPACRR